MSPNPPDNRYIAETTFHVRYAETDAMGIVHHSNYLVYFEEGRSHYARERGSDYSSFEKTGYYLAVTEVNARYIKPIRYDQRITIRTWIENIQSRAVTFAYQIVLADSGEICMTGTTRHVCITHAGQIANLPAEWRAWTD